MTTTTATITIVTTTTSMRNPLITAVTYPSLLPDDSSLSLECSADRQTHKIVLIKLTTVYESQYITINLKFTK